MSYAKKPDTNQPELVRLMRRVPGMRVQVVSMHPNLGYDCISRFQDGPPHMIEIKSRKGAKLTESEQAARAFFGEYWHRVETFEDWLQAHGIDTEPAPF